MSFDQQIKVPGSVHIPAGAAGAAGATGPAGPAPSGTGFVHVTTGSLDTPTDSPQITSIELGHATDTTLTRVSAGVVAVEGVTLQNRVANVSDVDLGCIADLATTGGAGHFLKQNSTGGTATSGTIATADLPWPMIIPAGSTTAGANGERWIGPLSGSTVSTYVNMPTGGIVIFGVNGVNKASIGLGVIQIGAVKGDSSLNLYTASNDGADALLTSLTGGGAVTAPGASATRGSGLESAGNEHATRPGQLSLMAGAVTGGKVVAYDKNAALALQVDETGVTHAVPVIFTTTQTSAGATISNDWRGSAGQLTRNVPTSGWHDFTQNGSSIGCIGSDGTYGWRLGTNASTNAVFSYGGDTYLDTGAAAILLRVASSQVAKVSATGLSFMADATLDGTLNSLCRTSTGLKLVAPAASLSSIGAGGAGTTLPEVCVYGASHAGSPGAVEVKAASVARANSGSWISIYSLSKGSHLGTFWLHVIDAGLGTRWAWYDIQGTSIAYYAKDANAGHTFVNSGAETNANIALRVSGGNLQINIGTTLAATMTVAVRFTGTVV